MADMTQGPLVQQTVAPPADAYGEAIRRLKTQYPQYKDIPDDELATKVSAQYPQYKDVLTKPVAPAGFMGSNSPLMSSKALLGVDMPKIPSPPLGLAIGPAAGLASSLLGRSAAQGGAAAADAAMKGERNPLTLATEAGKGALFSAGAEKALGPLANFISRQVGAKGAKAAYETAKGTHADDAARQIAQDLIDKVPALKGTEASGKGLYDAVYGAGKGKVSEAFDTSLKDVIAKGKGQVVQIPEEIASKLGLTNAGAGVAGLPANVQALFNKGAQKAGMTPAGQAGRLGVDAAELAEKVTGLWRKDPSAYRAAVKALDEAGIGDPAARAAYKTHTGISEFLDKAKALDAEGKLDPTKILKALSDLKKVGILQRRGLGSGTEGVIQQSARGAPTPPDIKTVEIPWYARHAMGAAPGAALGGSMGGPLGASAGGILGAILGHQVLPKELVTKGPLSPAVTKGAQGISDMLGLGTRKILAPAAASTGD